MIYENPDLPEGFNANKAANLRFIEADATAKHMIATYQNGYEKFWQPPRVAGERALSRDETQQILNASPGIADILLDGGAFVAFIESAHPGALPERYHSAPYPLDGLTITGDLKSEWEVQEPEGV